MARTHRKTYLHLENMENYVQGWFNYPFRPVENKSEQEGALRERYAKFSRDGHFNETKANTGFKSACKRSLRASNRKLCRAIMKSELICYNYDEPEDWVKPYDEFSSDSDGLEQHDWHPHSWDYYYFEDFDAKPYPDYKDGKVFYWGWY